MKGVPLHQIERERYHPRCGSVVNCEVIDRQIYRSHPLRGIVWSASSIETASQRSAGKETSAPRGVGMAMKNDIAGLNVFVAVIF